jgi:hypothetical protein
MDTIKTEEHLKKAIPYIMNEKKTKGLHYSNSGILPEQITNTFFMTKKRFPARGNRQAYHYKFSFSKDEKISSEVAFSFIQEWTEEYLGDVYDFVCSVHQDREHLHMHLIFNSVCRTGSKYHYKKGEWNSIIKPLTNRLADKYHTGHLKEKDDTLDYSSDYKSKKNGVDWQARVQSDIDVCISRSKSYSDFKRKMVTEFHYQLREGVSRDYGVYLSLMPPGKGKAVRSYRLDKGYMPVDIEEKIEGRYVMPETDGVQNFDMNYHGDNVETYRKSLPIRKNRKLDWIMSRNYTFIPYQNLSEYQKALVRRTLEAKRLYRRTGTSLQLHEQSVRAIKGMMGEVKDVGVYRKKCGHPTSPSFKQKKRGKVQRETEKGRQK